jgi:hypothetical protein
MKSSPSAAKGKWVATGLTALLWRTKQVTETIPSDEMQPLRRSMGWANYTAPENQTQVTETTHINANNQNVPEDEAGNPVDQVIEKHLEEAQTWSKSL